MLALKYSHQLSWGELKFIEDPMHAIRTVESEHGRRIGGKSIENAHLHDLPNGDDRRFDPYRFLKTKLERGDVFLVNRATLAPAVTSLEIDADGNPEYTLRNSTSQYFQSAFRSALMHIPVPKPMGVLRDEPKPAQAKQKEKEKPKKKKLLTISKIARKLRMMEGSSRYEEARFHASKIGWEGICSLVEVGHPENDPNLMPSRFMILPGASDEGLRKRGNLNNYPYSVHPDTPKQMSVYNLRQFLILGGYLAGEKPFWQSKDQLSKEQLQQLKQDGGLENDVIAPLTGVAEMDDKVEAALNSFLGKQSLDEPKGGGSYTVKEGDTLSAISQQHKLPNWQALWNFNKHTIKNPDLIYPGSELDIPDLADNEFEPWFYEFDNGEDVWRGSKHYQFPAKYFSLTLLDRSGHEIENKLNSQFEGYLKNPTLFYCLNVKKSDDISVLMPVTDYLGMGFDDNEFIVEGIESKSFKDVLYGNSSNKETLNFDFDDDEELLPTGIELA